MSDAIIRSLRFKSTEDAKVVEALEKHQREHGNRAWMRNYSEYARAAILAKAESDLKGE